MNNSPNFPDELKSLSLNDLARFTEKLRHDMIASVSTTGGHLGAGLGVVELTVALHYVFDTPHDILVWDIGHQTYPHKMLTGRRDKIHTIRQSGGLSGFASRAESIYDHFGAGHSSTSISAALGMAVGRDLSGEDRNVIAIIGDGAMSAGMAYEAMNNAGSRKEKLIVILNDNDMSISPPVGAMSKYLAKLIASQPYLNFRHLSKKAMKHLPAFVKKYSQKLEKQAKDWLVGSNLFEEMGFYYIGPIDGHDLENLIAILTNIKNDKDPRPILLHVATKKGCGYQPAENATDKFHGVSKFDIETGKPLTAVNEKGYSDVFADSLTALAEHDLKILAITAAMLDGTGLASFAAKFQSRCFDVGIAEQHAVTFAAGLAASGYKPFVAIYSTFMQRAYDQVIHDVAIQSLPVRFVMDRAGFVGADGATHAGIFDIAFLSAIPNVILMAPSDSAELDGMICLMTKIDQQPSFLRIPRGNAEIVSDKREIIIGKARIVIGHDLLSANIAIICYGTILTEGRKLAKMLITEGKTVILIDARFAKPLDKELFIYLASISSIMITIEEASSGGFGSNVTSLLLDAGILDNGKLKLRNFCIPDRFFEHDSVVNQRQQAGIDAESILDELMSNVNHII